MIRCSERSLWLLSGEQTGHSVAARGQLRDGCSSREQMTVTWARAGAGRGEAVKSPETFEGTASRVCLCGSEGEKKEARMATRDVGLNI